jgi:hypothetical protein
MLLQNTIVRRCFGLMAALLAAVSLLAARPALAEGGSGPAAGQRGTKVWAAYVPNPQPAVIVPGVNPTIPTFIRSELAVFARTVRDGQAGVLRGLYVHDVLALRVVHQPATAAFYVDLTPGTATQYDAASAYGVTGLLADNVASGVLFYDLQPGQTVNLIYGDGAIRRYVVTALDQFQALSPTDPYSDFLNLTTGERVPATTLFAQMYAGGDKVTLQTCIAQDGVMSWGRLFVTAVPAH